MTRTGPNQDINDPETIIELNYLFQQDSDIKGNFLAQSDAQNPNASGLPIIDVSIPFKMLDGSTELLFGRDIDVDDLGEFIYNSGLVFNGTIVTYVDLAERFRDYWNALNNILDQLADFDYSQDEDIEPNGPFTTVFPNGFVFSHGSLGGTAHDLSLYSHIPTESVETLEWDGVGPTDYNQLTYPQLLSALTSISILRNVSQISWNTDYSYSKDTDAFGGTRGANARFGKTEDFISNNEQQYVQFHNPGLTDMHISLSMSIVASFDTTFSAGVFSWAEIDNLNQYPEPFGGTKAFLSSWQTLSDTKTGGGTLDINDTRVIVIPPGKSAFVGGGASANTTFFTEDKVVASVSCVVTLNGKTITHSVDLV